MVVIILKYHYFEPKFAIFYRMPFKRYFQLFIFFLRSLFGGKNDPTIFFSEITPQRKCKQHLKEISTSIPMFTAALATTRMSNSACPLQMDGFSKLWHIYLMENYLATNKSSPALLAIWVNPEDTVQHNAV